MKPIRYEMNPNVIKINHKEIEDVYTVEVETHLFMPEFLEKIYKESNAMFLKDANKSLQYYYNEKNTFKYVGTWVSADKKYAVEYYIDGNERLVTYVVDNPYSTSKKYYPALTSVRVSEKEKDDVQ